MVADVGVLPPVAVVAADSFEGSGTACWLVEQVAHLFAVEPGALAFELRASFARGSAASPPGGPAAAVAAASAGAMFSVCSGAVSPAHSLVECRPLVGCFRPPFFGFSG